MGKRVLHDEYFKKAKADGYVARSAYKLQEIHRRFTIVRHADRVLDVGCAPGSWMQVTSDLVGPEGRVVGIDLLPVRHPMPANVRTVQGDATRYDASELASLAAPDGQEPEPFDTVLSDMAPNTSGHGDDLVSARLCRDVLGICVRVLRPGGRLVMKILEGSEYSEVLSETRELFREARGFRPKSTREVSREMFIVGLGFRAPRTPPPPPAPPAPVEGWSS